MERLIAESKTYKYYEYTNEAEFDKVLVDNATQILGRIPYILTLNSRYI
ncbi:MAG: hypothetical protein JW870_17535 [Candidatus Delongbacteria bacterium]|nr:hypothetical protein [Candidatus Delongbacteria bacterium]